MTGAAPTVSIGLPVYNGERYLEQTLRSLLEQTFADFDLTIADNASTDGSEEIARTWAARDSRVRYVRSDVNLGAAKNFNRVFRMSRGKYFKWAAYDDLCAPEFLQRCVQVLEEDDNVVLCYPRTTLLDRDGRITGYYADALDLRDPRPHRRYRLFFQRQGLCHPTFGVIRRTALAASGLWGRYQSADRVLLAELVLHGEFRELEQPLFWRRIHPDISTAVNPTAAAMGAWFSGSAANRFIFPRWRRLAEYAKGIQRAPLNSGERFRCHLEIARFALVPRRWAGLFGDVAAAATALITRRVRPSQRRGATR